MNIKEIRIDVHQMDMQDFFKKKQYLLGTSDYFILRP